jgi:hypothetical protein
MVLVAVSASLLSNGAAILAGACSSENCGELEDWMAFSTLLGLAMVAAAVILFVLVAPRRGQMNPPLRSHRAEYGVTICIVVLVIVGGAFALMGFPAVMNPAVQR